MGIKTSGSFKKGHSIINTGRTHFQKGMVPWNKGLKIKSFNTGVKNGMYGKHSWNYGISNPVWRGTMKEYYKIHYWIRKKLGKAKDCWFNKDHISSKYHWANISKSYLEDVNDWTSLCASCHAQYDLILNGRAKK